MKFQDLSVGDTFTTEYYPHMKILKKTVYKKASCCSGESNALAIKENGVKKNVFVKDDAEVQKVEKEQAEQAVSSKPPTKRKVEKMKNNTKKPKKYGDSK